MKRSDIINDPEFGNKAEAFDAFDDDDGPNTAHHATDYVTDLPQLSSNIPQTCNSTMPPMPKT